MLGAVLTSACLLTHVYHVEVYLDSTGIAEFWVVAQFIQVMESLQLQLDCANNDLEIAGTLILVSDTCTCPSFYLRPRERESKVFGVDTLLLQTVTEELVVTLRLRIEYISFRYFLVIYYGTNYFKQLFFIYQCH